MTDLLTDSAAVVTGGMSGNGRAIARAFAEEGADVVIADIRDEPRECGAPTQEVIESETEASAAAVDCDVTELADLEAAVEAAETFGGVDVMVNNAGIFRAEDFLSVTESAFDHLMEVNLKSVFFGTQLAAERMTTEDVPVLGTAAEDEFFQQIPSGRAGRPEEVADAALYLASEMSSYVTGESLVVDGGMTHTG